MSCLRVFCITPDSGGSIVGVETYNREFPLGWVTTVVTGLSNALTDTYCRNGGLSMNYEAAFGVELPRLAVIEHKRFSITPRRKAYRG